MAFFGIKRLLARIPGFDVAFGNVVFETAPLKGQSSHSTFQWRVRKTGDGERLLIGLKMKPDYYAGVEGSPTNYLNFSLEAAEQIKRDLEICIEEYQRRIA